MAFLCEEQGEDLAFLAQIVQSMRDMLGMLDLLPPTAGDRAKRKIPTLLSLPLWHLGFSVFLGCHWLKSS